ncbi:hypothetical protein GCM10027190_18380 [Spirosoma areae]
MEDFTAEQISGITSGYYHMARALNEFQVRHWPALTHEQHLDLNAYQNSLLSRADDLQTCIVRPAFTNAADVSATIQQATEAAKTSLTYITSPPLALNVGAITVALASYVARANLRGIEIALRELNELMAMNE